MTFSDLVDQHIGLSFRKQFALLDFLGKHAWKLDLKQGKVDFGKAGLFGKRRVFPLQLLGSEAEETGKWQWVWWKKASDFPSDPLRAVERIKSFGEAEGIRELTDPELDSASYPGHLIALVCTGIEGADCYYRVPYAGGALFFLLGDTPIPGAPPTPTVRIAKVLTHTISEFSVNHRAMTEAFLKAEGFHLASTADQLTATADDGRSLVVRFDARGRIAGINTSATR
jgi:hypothetical protein